MCGNAHIGPGPAVETQPNFTPRGIGVGAEYNSNAASAIDVHVDEVYQSFRASHGQQLFGMDQIEVVRGSSGSATRDAVTNFPRQLGHRRIAARWVGRL